MNFVVNVTQAVKDETDACRFKKQVPYYLKAALFAEALYCLISLVLYFIFAAFTSEKEIGEQTVNFYNIIKMSLFGGLAVLGVTLLAHGVKYLRRKVLTVNIGTEYRVSIAGGVICVTGPKNEYYLLLRNVGRIVEKNECCYLFPKACANMPDKLVICPKVVIPMTAAEWRQYIKEHKRDSVSDRLPRELAKDQDLIREIKRVPFYEVAVSVILMIMSAVFGIFYSIVAACQGLPLVSVNKWLTGIVLNSPELIFGSFAVFAISGISLLRIPADHRQSGYFRMADSDMKPIGGKIGRIGNGSPTGNGCEWKRRVYRPAMIAAAVYAGAQGMAILIKFILIGFISPSSGFLYFSEFYPGVLLSVSVSLLLSVVCYFTVFAISRTPVNGNIRNIIESGSYRCVCLKYSADPARVLIFERKNDEEANNMIQERPNGVKFQ